MNTNTEVDDAKNLRGGERRASAEDEVMERLARMKETGANAGAEIAKQVRKSPLLAVGIAAGVGFLGGSLFGTRVGRFLLVLAAGYMAEDLAEGAFGKGGLRRILGEEAARAVRAKH